MCCGHLNRRDFLTLTSAAMAGAGLSSPSMLMGASQIRWDPDEWNPGRPLVCTGQTLSGQPVLTYSTPRKRETTSWKSWGGVLTEQAASEEVERIGKELNSMSPGAAFPLKILPVVKVKTAGEATQVRDGDHDVLVLYPAAGSGLLLRASTSGEGDALVFVLHRSGPVYYWYEALSVKYLSTSEEMERGQLSVQDVVVDDYQELLWRLRALYGVKNFIGARIVALGDPGGKYALKPFGRYMFSGRRHFIRRMADRKTHLYVDRYDRRLLIPLFLIIVLPVFDAWVTIFYVKRGAREINPFMDILIGYENIYFFTVKYVATVLSLIILCMYKNLYIARIGILFILFLYFVVFTHHIYFIF